MKDRIRWPLRGTTVPGWLLCLLAVANVACARQVRSPDGSTPMTASGGAGTPQLNSELATLRDEVARLKRLVPSQASEKPHLRPLEQRLDVSSALDGRIHPAHGRHVFMTEGIQKGSRSDPSSL